LIRKGMVGLLSTRAATKLAGVHYKIRVKDRAGSIKREQIRLVWVQLSSSRLLFNRIFVQKQKPTRVGEWVSWKRPQSFIFARTRQNRAHTCYNSGDNTRSGQLRTLPASLGRKLYGSQRWMALGSEVQVTRRQWRCRAVAPPL